MKLSHLLFAIFLLTASASKAAAQRTQPTAPAAETQTKIETFQARTGAVIVKNYSDIGKLSGLGAVTSVTSYEFIDAQTGRHEYGIGIELKETSRLEREERAYIDYDEIDSLLKGIDYISKIDNTVTRLKNYEATYKTKGELSVTTFNGNTGYSAAVSVGRIGRVSAYYKVENLAEFRKLIVDAKAALDAVRQ